MDLKRFFSELQRRKVYRLALGYVVAAWVIIQVATQVFPFFFPTWTVQVAVILVIVGFPIALILSWAFDLTPQGIKRTQDLAAPSLPAVDIPEKSIAVLPFENLSDDQQNTYIADGIQDDILSSLARLEDLKVISRTSVRQYRGGERNLREIGAALGVAHILEGTVRRSGNRVRVNTQLIDARTDAHVWADTFDREMTDLFALQSELAEKIATALQANLSPQEMASIQMHPTADLEAYELYLRARDLFRWSGSGEPRANGEAALRLLDEALRRDPQFALAHTLASRFHAELFWFGYDRTRARLDRAKAEAETALRIRSELGDARLALAYYHYYGAREYDLAREQLALARKATPNDGEVWDAIGAVDRRQGRWSEAVLHFEKARLLDPRNIAILWNLAETYNSLSRFDEAVSTFTEGLAINPNAHLLTVAIAAIEIRRNGATAPLRNVLQKIPAGFDPGGAVTMVTIRLALMERDYAEADRLLTASSLAELTDMAVCGTAGVIDGFSFPRQWFEGMIRRGLGDVEGARRAFLETREITERAAHECGCGADAKTFTMLGLIDAALGRKEKAVENGRSAVELLSQPEDAFDRPVHATNLAVIYAQLGETDRALDELSKVVQVPNGPTSATLRVEPEWDPLRGNLRFEEMAAAGVDQRSTLNP